MVYQGHMIDQMRSTYRISTQSPHKLSSDFWMRNRLLRCSLAGHRRSCWRCGGFIIQHVGMESCFPASLCINVLLGAIPVGVCWFKPTMKISRRDDPSCAQQWRQSLCLTSRLLMDHCLFQASLGTESLVRVWVYLPHLNCPPGPFHTQEGLQHDIRRWTPVQQTSV